jgi:segregation and condensation protein B
MTDPMLPPDGHEPAQTSDTEVVRAIEAIVMVASEPVPPGLLAQLVERPVARVEELCARLAEAYADAGHGFELARVAGGYRFQSHADLAPFVERYVLDGQRARLSAAALETLAIVAYKQPISRAQIAAIRGVDPDGVLRTLAGRGYITELERDTGPGQAVLWGTTPAFLEKLGIDSVNDLPPLAGFVPGADVVEALEHGLRITDDGEMATHGSPTTNGHAATNGNGQAATNGHAATNGNGQAATNGSAGPGASGGGITGGHADVADPDA